MSSSAATRSENLALSLGAAGAVAGAPVGAVALRTTAPLAGTDSIGQVAAISAFLVSGAVAASVIAVVTPRAHPWMRALPWWRRAFDVIGLSLVFALLGFFLVSALFQVLQQAFIGVALDRVAGAFWVAAATGLWTYVTVAAAASLTGRSLASLLALFLTLGVLAAAMRSADPYWWERYFSDLGARSDRASTTFNLTLLLTGIALLTVAEFLSHDLRRWSLAAAQPLWKVRVVRAVLSAMGVLVALVALIPVDVSRFWHDVVAWGLVAVFGSALIVFPLLLRSLPGGLPAFTGAAFGMLVALIVMFEGIGYLNMTAFEMGAAITVYGWLLLFIRTVSAAAEGAEERQTAPAVQR